MKSNKRRRLTYYYYNNNNVPPEIIKEVFDFVKKPEIYFKLRCLSKRIKNYPPFKFQLVGMFNGLEN